jgi:type I restriction enzyme R subunit
MYSEDALIEQTCATIFRDQLGWQVINAQHGETFGPTGLLGRNAETELILLRPFRVALERFNPDLPEGAYSNAIETFLSAPSTLSLTDINHEKYNYIREGIPTTYLNTKSELQSQRLKVIDYSDAETNEFLAVRQLWISGKSKRKRRPDIIGYINGIPLLFIELKAHHRKLESAFDDNLTDYKDVIPGIFHHNAFVILSNGLESKIGAITSKFEFFHDWKRIREEETGMVSLDTILRGVCDKTRFLDLLENFILFDDSGDGMIKLIARNHQFIGVNKTVDHYTSLQQKFQSGEITKEERQRLGVFWHTQGSGKSYSMAFLAQKMHRKLPGSFTFLVVTDREELDKQIYGTFTGVGLVDDKQAKATSGQHLRERLAQDHRFIFTLIHKFNFEEEITQRSDIIVFSDEAHRTQSGSLALNMRKAMPNACFIGFTGTPLFKDDELTRRIFGDYVSVYDFKRSVDDGATVPLYYENRGEKLKLDNPHISQQLRDAIEESDLDQDQQEAVKQAFARDYHVITAEKRLRSIARDVVWHFNHRGYKGKAMFVAIDKITAVKMFNFMQEEWKTYIQTLEIKVKKAAGDQERLEAQRDLEWVRETEIAVVVSQEQNEIKKFTAWGLDIEPHRMKINERDLETEFKDKQHPFRLAIVCAMWITGFDVPSLSTMYIDKPLKSHTLMQTIARANRVHGGKNNGLIVDYIETYKSLLEALAIYGTGRRDESGKPLEDDKANRPIEEIERLSDELHASIDMVTEHLHGAGFDLGKLVSPPDQLHRIAAIEKGLNAIYTTDEIRYKFEILARDVFKKYKALTPHPATYGFKARRDAINALYAMLQHNTGNADISEVMSRVQRIVDASIENLDIALERPEDYGVRVDLSSLDFKKIEAEFSKPDRKNITFNNLRDVVDHKLEQMLRDNPLRIDYYEKYQEIIDEYNRGKDAVSIEKLFAELKRLVDDLTLEESRAVKEGLSEEQLTVFDLLLRGKALKEKEQHAVKEIARTLLDRLQLQALQVPQWWEKSQTSATVRTTINDYLFEQLPYPEYGEDDIRGRSEAVYGFLVGRFAA